MSNSSLLDSSTQAILIDKMWQRGIIPPPGFIADNEWHRCGTDGREDGQDGAYKIYRDLEGAEIENHRDGLGVEHINLQRPKNARVEGLNAKIRQWEKDKSKPTRADIQAEWDSATPATSDHPYAAKKQLSVDGLRQKNNCLRIPAYDFTGLLRGIQKITPLGDNEKQWLNGSVGKDVYYLCGNESEIVNSATVCVAEGWATAESIYQSTSYPTFCTFGKDNLLSVTTFVRNKYGNEICIIVCGDNDLRHPSGENVGEIAAREAAFKNSALLSIAPVQDDKNTDFSDIYLLLGKDEVKRCVDAAVPPKGKIEILLEKSGLYKINVNTPSDKISYILGELANKLENLNETEKRLLRSDIIVVLERLDIKSPSRIVDAVFREKVESKNEAIETDTEPDTDIHPDPVSTAEILDELSNTIQQYLMIGDRELVAVVLWILAAAIFHRDKWPWEYLPILSIKSPEKRSGKSLLCDLMYELLPSVRQAVNITPAALYRLLDKQAIPIIIDDFDSMSDELRTELRNVLNASFQRGKPVIRCDGQDFQPREFEVFGPIAISAIGELSDTVRDRSIPIKMVRKLRIEKRRRINRKARDVLRDLSSKVARWAQDTQGRLGQLADQLDERTMPEALSDRARDIWEGLIVISSDGGSKWLKSAIEAAKLSVDIDDNESIRIELLKAIKSLFFDNERDEPLQRISSKRIIDELTNDDSNIWSEYCNGKPITPYQLSKILKMFSIKPKVLDFYIGSSRKQLRGYEYEQFRDVFSRYCPNSRQGGEKSVSPSQDDNSSINTDSYDVTDFDKTKNVVTDSITSQVRDNTRENDSCDGLTDFSGGDGEISDSSNDNSCDIV